MFDALRNGTPNRNRIAMQMVKDMLDESSFEASPGSSVPSGPIGRAARRLAEKVLDRTDEEQPLRPSIGHDGAAGAVLVRRRLGEV